MIPFDFIYCLPNTLREAYDAFWGLASVGKNPVYYAGGSEIITMCRAGSIRPGAVVDIKTIPECQHLFENQDALHIGSACTLNQIKESKLFPLLSLSCGRIADHTNQCRITLGGNLCGTIMYRETSLPFLLSDATVQLFGKEGLHMVSFQSVFDGRMRLEPGELVVKLSVPRWALTAPHFHAKHAACEKIDYPLVSMAALQKDGKLRVAFSGLCARPFRSANMEEVLNNRSLSFEERAQNAAKLLPEPAHGDAEGSGEYRLFVLKNTLQALLEEAEYGAV